MLGEHHPDTLTVRGNLASSLRELGDVTGAAELQRQVLADRIDTLGEHHPHTLAARNNLAWSLWDLGEGEEAIEQMTEAVVGWDQLQPDHPHATASRRAFGAWFAESPKPESGIAGVISEIRSVLRQRRR
jgi:hypothetical protein